MMPSAAKNLVFFCMLALAVCGCRRRYQVVESFELSEGGGCATLRDGSFWCWGSELDEAPALPGRPLPAVRRSLPREQGFVLRDQQLCRKDGKACESLGAEVLSFSSGPHHACVALQDGTAKCRGEGQHGELGDGTTSSPDALRAVPGVRGAVQVAVGDRHSCARTDLGAVFCWGSNDEYAVSGPERGVHAPTQVLPLIAVISIGAGPASSCAALTDGGLRCWGTARAVPGKSSSLGRPTASHHLPMPVMFP